MSILTAISQGRAAAEAAMLDTCTVTRQTGTVFNPGTGNYDPTTSTIYTGKCKVQTLAGVAGVLDVDVGDTEAGVVRWSIHLPVVGSETVKRDDVITVTAAVLDSALVGKTFIVQAEHTGTAKTARRLPVDAKAA